MSRVMDKPTGTRDEDRASLKSDEKAPADGAAKETQGILRTFKNSIRRAAERSPLGSKVTTGADAAGNELEPRSPPSPSPSAGAPGASPSKQTRGLFQKKEEDEASGAPQRSKGLTRSKTDPSMVRFGDSFMKKGASFRRSLRFSAKKDKTCRQEPPVLVAEGSAEENREEEQAEEVVWEEMEEAYALPDIPHTPLSVMQINKLIEMEVLEEAHLNLLALRQEFQQERERCGEDSSMELAKKEKDLSLLYGDLRNKVNAIVRDSSSFPARNKALLVPVARIIQEEERRAAESGGLPDSWVEAWREAVGEGVRLKVESVHLERREQNVSWLAVHLGLLGKAIVEDLENVKRELRWSYPPSFKVFGTYVESYHRVVGQHLRKLEPQVTELKDLYALLDWIINRYKSERIMGNLSLQPDMREQSAELQLEADCLTQLNLKFCRTMKEDMRSYLERTIKLEIEEVWRSSRAPEKEDDFLNSPIHMDVWTTVKGKVVNCRNIGAQLERRVISCCLEELEHFPRRFETEFRRRCSSSPLWTEYQITYINNFTSLQLHMDGYQDACPEEVEGFRKEVKRLIVRLMQDLEDRFKDDVKVQSVKLGLSSVKAPFRVFVDLFPRSESIFHLPWFLRRMMTRKWLTNDDDFRRLYDRTELLSQHCALMRPPHAQELASRLHHHVVREYVGQLMRSNYSCKNRKHEKAARKIRVQSAELRDLFDVMKSTHEWLHPVGDDLSAVIAQKNKTDIKNQLQPLVEHFPDFSRKHLVALLYFRGLLRGREHQRILQRLAELQEKLGGDKSRVLFGDIKVTVNTDCLSNLPFSCLGLLLPDS